MKKNIVIIHYNTPHLTECLVRSINMFMNDAIIYIFDNSDREPFTATFDNVTIINNTKGQIIDFNKWLDSIKTKVYSPNNWASAKHCYTIEKCMEILKDNFILLDSDVLLKKDLSDLYDNNYVYVGDIEKWKGNERVIPYCCFINTKMCEDNNIHYFNQDYIVGLTPNKRYDTGANFYLECKKLPSKKIIYTNYVVHMDNGSQLYATNKSSQELFLSRYKNLYTNITNETVIKDYREELKQFCKKHRFNINIDNPRTIQDKINWLKVNDLSPLKTDCADKVKVHEYCKEKLGKDICIPIIKTYNSSKEINWDELPNKFVIKCNHGSGMNIIVKDKTKLDKNDCIAKLNKWMLTDFAFSNGYELQYHNIQRKIFVEEYKNDGHETLHDYKFWCFNGEPKIWTINDGNGHGDIMYYSMDGKEMNLYGVKHHDEYTKPSKFDEMIEYSKKLSEPFKFVRVDFYEVSGIVYLGELTFTPGSGFFSYKNRSDSVKVGDLLDLNIGKVGQKTKKVVYTCITGDYDKLIEPKVYSNDFDYICFTDNPNLKSNTWLVKPLPEETEGLSQVKKQRYVKINAHKVLPEYDLSIWVDGNVLIKGDLNEFIGLTLTDDTSVYVPQHPLRNCLYDEAKAVVSMKKDVREIVNPQMERYKADGFPKDYGLLQSNILLRIHNDDNCIRLMEAWFNELKDNSHRDQLSFNYVLWKNNDVNVVYMDKNIYKSKWFHWNSIHKKATAYPKPKTQESIESLKKVFKETINKRKISTFNVKIY